MSLNIKIKKKHTAKDALVDVLVAHKGSAFKMV